MCMQFCFEVAQHIVSAATHDNLKVVYQLPALQHMMTAGQLVFRSVRMGL